MRETHGWRCECGPCDQTRIDEATYGDGFPARDWVRELNIIEIKRLAELVGKEG